MYYSCAKFRDFTFSRLGFVMQTNRHTQMPLNALLPRLLSARIIMKLQTYGALKK